MISDTLERIHAGGWVNKSPADDYWYEPRGIETVSGEDVDEDVALTFSDVFACVNKIAKTVATLPVQVYEKLDAKTRQPADHELNDLLTTEANADATGLTLRESILANLLLWGESFVVVDWNNGRTEVRRLTQLPAREMDPVDRDEDGNLMFVWRPLHGRPQPIPADRMWYTPGLSINGTTGVSPVAYNREAIGLGHASTKFRSAFFGNGAWAGGFLQRPLEAPDLSPEKAERFLESLNEKFRGASKAFGFGLLREGMEFKQIDMPFEDAMFLGTARLTRIQICGMFDVPLMKIQDDERNTMKNAEQNDLIWAKDCLLPWCVRLETSARRRFFPQSNYYLRHNLAGVMRGDFQTRIEGYNLGITIGLWSINECRALEDFNPVDGGDVHFRQLNLGILGEPVVQQVGGDKETAQRLAEISHLLREQCTERPEQIAREVRFEQLMQGAQEAYQKQGRTIVRVVKKLGAEVDGIADGQKSIAGAVGDLAARMQPAEPIESFQACVASAAKRIASKECKAIANALKRRAKEDTPDAFVAWLEKFYGEHVGFVAEVLDPVFVGYERAAKRPIRPTAREFAEQYADQCYDTVRASLESPAGVAELLDHWNESKAQGLTAGLCDLLRGANDARLSEST